MASSASSAGMHITTQQEEFSYAYIDAVVTVAGYAFYRKPRAIDNVGMDIGIEAPGQIGKSLSPKFDAQVKCTSDSRFIKNSHISYPLPVHNYKRLISTAISTPQILIVVFVPKEPFDWLKATENETTIQNCAYWMSLRGEPETTNTDNITVRLPRYNLLTPQSLQVIMQRIADSEDL